MSETQRETRTTWIVVALILLGGAYLRLVDLETNPPGLWQDEASTGLDALLLWTTGRDRNGQLLPIIARSFGDYPLTLYRYLTAPIVGLFGLSIGHERLVAALGGTSLLVSTFAWARLALGVNVAVGALVAGAIAPTWVHFSRYGSEAILLPATLMGGLALIEHARARGRRWSLFAGALALALSTHTYHAVKVFLPLWMIPFLWYQRPFLAELWRDRRRELAIACAIFAAVTLPAVHAALTPEGMARGKTVAAWYHHKGGDLLRTMLRNYLGYFEPEMLYVSGGPAIAQSIPGVGLWNLIDLPLMIAGLVVCARRFEERRAYGLLVAWFLLGPVPGGITYETHNVGRVIGWLPAPQLLSGIGFGALYELSSRGHRALGSLITFAVVAGWAITAATVFRLTLSIFPQIAERDFQYEVSRAIQCAKAKAEGRKIVLSPSFSAVDLFGEFHLGKATATSTPTWTIANRSRVGPREIYAFPANQAPPAGAMICEIKTRRSGEINAYVYGAIAPEK